VWGLFHLCGHKMMLARCTLLDQGTKSRLIGGFSTLSLLQSTLAQRRAPGDR
jgi:hypothetical protein